MYSRVTSQSKEAALPRDTLYNDGDFTTRCKCLLQGERKGTSTVGQHNGFDYTFPAKSNSGCGKQMHTSAWKLIQDFTPFSQDLTIAYFSNFKKKKN